MPDIKKYLNRDGLDEYNSLLPHSSAEMQTYVNEWMDEHPEASTTVQDGAITERKLADKSVSLRTLADDTVHILKGAILTGNLSGEVLTADDAYSAPPVALTVEGKSTQDGTPTPEAPVEIVSLEQANLWIVGKNLIDVCNDPENPDKGWRSSGGGTTLMQYDSANNGFYTTNHRQLLLFHNATDAPITVTASILAKRREGTASYAIITSYPSSSAISTFPVYPTSYTSNYTRYESTATIVSGGDFYITIYNQIYIQSVQLELGSTATAYQPYNGSNVLLNLTQALRSLPNGTHDTLSLAYLRPSTREGWAWYSAEMVQRVCAKTFNGANMSGWSITSNGTYPYYQYIWGSVAGSGAYDWTGLNASNSRCSNCTYVNYISIDNNAIGYSNTNYSMRYRYQDMTDKVASLTDLAAFFADSPVTFMVPMQHPITTQLDPIELPILPAPDVTVWSDPSTGLTMEYVRDANIVIQNIEQAIADQ